MFRCLLLTRQLPALHPPRPAFLKISPRSLSTTPARHCQSATDTPPTATRSTLDRLLAGNKIFSARTALHSADEQAALAQGQHPGVLWIGCSDSRVPETTLCDARPGDICVHRNVANVVGAGDGSVAAVVDFAVAQLGVAHVVVCGHTRCAGARAALEDARPGLGPVLNAWLEPVRRLRRERAGELAALAGEDERADRLAEFSVLRSLESLMRMRTVAEKVAAGQLEVHGLIYDVPSAELRLLTT